MTQGIGDSGDATSIMPAAVITAPTRYAGRRRCAAGEEGRTRDAGRLADRRRRRGGRRGLPREPAAREATRRRRRLPCRPIRRTPRRRSPQRLPTRRVRRPVVACSRRPSLSTARRSSRRSRRSTARPSRQLIVAIKSGDIDKVAAKFPGMTPEQRGYFTGVIFGQGHTVGKTQAVWHEATIAGDTAKMPLDIRVQRDDDRHGIDDAVPAEIRSGVRPQGQQVRPGSAAAAISAATASFSRSSSSRRSRLRRAARCRRRCPTRRRAASSPRRARGPVSSPRRRTE